MPMILLLACFIAGAAATTPDSHPFVASATSGAAPGYLPDEVCANCHATHADSYRHVGMSQSFAAVASAKAIEDFDENHFYHERSDRHYEMERIDDELVFRRYQLDHEGERINEFQVRVDWVLGSGNRARSYLVRMPSGRLFQLPIGWYPQTQEWGMSPGYDKRFHPGLKRDVRRECMFCHNAYPDVPAGSDARGMPHTFPADLPQGTGCQRCHGPGEQHVRSVLKGTSSLQEMRGSILNPGKLPPEEELQVCFQCHLLPSVTITGIRRFDAHDYSHRPGNPLADYLLSVDIDVEGEERAGRFEINHHPYRLMQSRCFIQSRGSENPVTCTSCHNPHVKPRGRQRFTHYRDACLQCHEKHDPDALMASLQTSVQAEDLAYIRQQTVRGIEAPAEQAFEPDNCFACHMPQRRTRDVVKVTMTDHLITETPGGKALLAPREESEQVLLDLEFFDKASAPRGDEGEIYRVSAFLRHEVTEDAAGYLEKLLARTPSPSPVSWSDLANAQIKLGRFADAIAVIEKHLLPADYPGAGTMLGSALLLDGQNGRAIEVLGQATAGNPANAASWYNLGLAYSVQKQPEQAESALRKAVTLEPLLERGWYYLALALQQQERDEEAMAALRKSLAVNPSFHRPYKTLVELLLSAGERDEARRYLLRGRKNIEEPAFLDSVRLE